MKSKKKLLFLILSLWIGSDLLTIGFENLLAHFTHLPDNSIIILNSLSITSILYLVNRKYKVVKIFIIPAHDTWLDKLVYVIPIMLYAVRALLPLLYDPAIWKMIVHHLPHSLMLVLAMITAVFFEEYLSRGLIFGALLVYFKHHKWRVQLSILLSSLTFSLSHAINLFNQNAMQTLNQMIYTFAFGCLVSMMYIRSGSLLIPFLAHCLLNLPSFLYSSSPLATAPVTLKTILMQIFMLSIFLVYTFIFINNDEKRHYQF